MKQDIGFEEIGHAFVNALITQHALGHVSAAGLADYVESEDIGEAGALVLNAFSSTRLDDRRHGGRSYVADWLNSSNLARWASETGAEYVTTIGD